MTVTIPLRVTQDIIELADKVLEERYGSGSRNSVLREMIARGFDAYFSEKKRSK